ncbi:MAG: thiamine pyrophosphate-dependent enzyme, partial [Pseudomonadota bacterium]
TFNMAAIWKLPVIFVIENNQYAMGTAQSRSTSTPALHTRGEAFGIDGMEVDGMDVLAVRDAGVKALEHCRSGKGPFILEIKTYRYRGHSMSDPAKYRTREEVSKMRETRDPIDGLRKVLIDQGIADEAALKAVDKEIKAVVNDAAQFAQESPEPALEELYTDILAEA